MKYDFCGWATKNGITCSDGVKIMKDAFVVNDKQRVPLCWNHEHGDPSKVLGHAILENRDEGVYAYCSFNKSTRAQDAKEAVMHGDVDHMSIWANNLQKRGNDVCHGVIREVSLVLAGANPGAFIESVLCHGEPMDEEDEEGVIYNSDPIYIAHADEDDDDSDDDYVGERTIGEIFDEMTDEQKMAVSVIVSQAASDDEEDEDEEYEEDEDEEYEEDDEMKHNIFDQEDEDMAVLSHADFQQILADGKRLGSLKEAIHANLEEGGVLAHAAIPTGGMDTAKGTSTYGFNDPDMLFPDYRALATTPEWLSRNMDWVGKVLASVHHTPFARIKSVFADITEDEARAKGYIKGKQKKEEVFSILKRTTDPQTVYKKQKMDRDDIIDITDFDVLAWIRAEMRVMLNEEIARAILIGDGRSADSDDKIQEIHIRPIVTDVDLFNIKAEVKTGATVDETAMNTIDTIIRSRKDYKGSGNPVFFTTEEVLTDMLLLRDKIGHKLYKSEAELATELRVKEIITVEPMEGATVNGKKLIGIVVNLADYNVGTNKGGEITMFDDFDIDYNQQKYLIETRFSGALIKPFSAITITSETAVGASTASTFSARRNNTAE